ncbi:hypothetical protein U1E44_12610 [Arenibacter sp. GZD96]|uniref:hypothetical protein n=1 Tax=Aurantibrevibacter litoralis TaxID=3106030 RepID=UPI002AFFE89D|nr:hypothetical protein [Arenibacter sp. GZD-96]MEA1786936.1 hypothetical protein [Arenibacter sp. GZD-96]
MTKYIKIGITLVMVFSFSFAFGQHNPDWDKIKTLKVAFFTEQLDLSSKEAELFWPLYNKYEEERHTIRKREWREVRDKLKDMSGISEKQANVLLTKYLAIEEEQEELDKAFLLKLSNVLSSRKTVLLLRAEEDFKRQLIRQSHQKRSND